MRKVLCICIIIILTIITPSGAFATRGEDTFSEAISRGSSAPGTNKTTALPYTASGNIYSNTYTNYQFKPTGSDITINFTGTCAYEVNYTLRLYSSSNVEQLTTLVYFPAKAGTVTTPHTWSNLNSNTYYYGSISKTDSSTLASIKGKYA